MEAMADVKGILGKIMPPRLEDAGLEDCALPPDAIKQAFAKAATAVRSVISVSSDDEETEGNCVNDPWPVAGDSSDELVGIAEGLDHIPGSCANEKGMELPDFASDAVAVRDEGEKTDEVVAPGPTAPGSGDSNKACIDGLQGLQIGEKSKGKLGKKKSSGKVVKKVDDGDESEGEKESEVPIVTEAYV